MGDTGMTGGIEPSSAGLFPSELSHMDTEILTPTELDVLF